MNEKISKEEKLNERIKDLDNKLSAYGYHLIKNSTNSEIYLVNYYFIDPIIKKFSIKEAEDFLIELQEESLNEKD